MECIVARNYYDVGGGLGLKNKHKKLNYKTFSSSLLQMSLSIGNDGAVGYGAAGGASWRVDYGATSRGVGVTGSVEGGILCYGREANSDLWIWSGNATAPSWACPSPRRHGCKQSRPDVNGTQSDPVCAVRTPCPPCGETPRRPRHRAARPQSKHLLPHAYDPLDPASSQLVATQSL